MPHVYKDESGRVIEVRMDEKITDPNHELAVQIPPEADGRNQHPLDFLLEPSPNDLAAQAAEADEAEKGDDEKDKE